jgi:hypothetical protein
MDPVGARRHERRGAAPAHEQLPAEQLEQGLGWESYQLSSNDRNLWVDDVAIATQRVGCPAP